MKSLSESIDLENREDVISRLGGVLRNLREQIRVGGLRQALDNTMELRNYMIKLDRDGWLLEPKMRQVYGLLTRLIDRALYKTKRR